jgi:hypothetical protein
MLEMCEQRACCGDFVFLERGPAAIPRVTTPLPKTTLALSIPCETFRHQGAIQQVLGYSARLVIQASAFPMAARSGRPPNYCRK